MVMMSFKLALSAGALCGYENNILSKQSWFNSKTNRSECDVEYDKFTALKSAW